MKVGDQLPGGWTVEAVFEKYARLTDGRGGYITLQRGDHDAPNCPWIKTAMDMSRTFGDRTWEPFLPR